MTTKTEADLTAAAKAARDATAKRNKLIVKLHADGAGMSLRAIAGLCDLSHMGVRKIIENT